MKERQTSYLLVILKHEKPIRDLPDVVADRLSKMEGVDGSGVTVSLFDAEAGKDFIVRAEAIEQARYNGDVVEPVNRQMQVYALAMHGDAEYIGNVSDFAIADQPASAYTSAYDKSAAELLQQAEGGETVDLTADPDHRVTAEESAALREAISGNEGDGFAIANKDNLTREEFDHYAAVLTKGMGCNV